MKWDKYLLLVCWFIPSFAFAQSGSIPELFKRIEVQPKILSCRNVLEVNNQGGHLQGVQIKIKDEIEYAILSGSSDTYAYYSVVKLDEYEDVLSVNNLMFKPYKHAGGIQILEDLMVVGIEDNEKKDRSKVCIYEVRDPEEPQIIPLAITEREGDPWRSTAGCCGISRVGNRYLIVVGDWDTKHLDFYLCDENLLEQNMNVFEKVYTIDTEKTDRSSWADKAWHAYQNINLLKDADGSIYLFGLGRNDEKKNIADLFLIEHKDLREFSLKKIISRTFICQQGADFQSGAGIFLQPDGKLKIISCAPHIKDSLILNVFD